MGDHGHDPPGMNWTLAMHRDPVSQAMGIRCNKPGPAAQRSTSHRAVNKRPRFPQASWWCLALVGLPSPFSRLDVKLAWPLDHACFCLKILGIIWDVSSKHILYYPQLSSEWATAMYIQDLKIHWFGRSHPQELLGIPCDVTGWSGEASKIEDDLSAKPLNPCCLMIDSIKNN